MEAGRLIMTYYRQGHAVDKKEDASPVTEADRAADRLIVAQLKALAPEILVVSEEGDKPDVTGADYFWLVDPLDGTKSFVRGNGHFTVNIGLIHRIPSPSRGEGQGGGEDDRASKDHRADKATGLTPSLILPPQGGGDVANGIPILGVIYDPVTGALYWGSEKGAFREDSAREPKPIVSRAGMEGRYAAYVSHSHLNQATLDYLERHGIEERIPCASSIKFCFLAEGKADVYPRFGPTMEWDTAAGHAILAAAGGHVVNPDGTPFLYGKQGFLNGDFVAGGSHALSF